MSLPDTHTHARAHTHTHTHAHTHTHTRTHTQNIYVRDDGYVSSVTCREGSTGGGGSPCTGSIMVIILQCMLL